MSKDLKSRSNSGIDPWSLIRKSKKIAKSKKVKPPIETRKVFTHSDQTSDSFIVYDDDIEEEEGDQRPKEKKTSRRGHETVSEDSDFNPDLESSSDISITSSALREGSSDDQSNTSRSRKKKKHNARSLELLRKEKEAKHNSNMESNETYSSSKQNNRNSNISGNTSGETDNKEDKPVIKSTHDNKRKKRHRTKERKYDRTRIFLQSLKNLSTYLTNMLDFGFVSLLEKNFQNDKEVNQFHKNYIFNSLMSYYKEKENLSTDKDIMNRLLTISFEPAVVVEYARKIFDKEISDGKISMNDIKREFSFPKGKIDYFDPDFFGNIKADVLKDRVNFALNLEAFKDKIYLKVIFCLIKKLIRFIRLFETIMSVLFGNCGKKFYFEVSLDFLYAVDQFKNSGLQILTKLKRTIQISETIVFHLIYKEIKGPKPQPFDWNY